MMRTGKFKTVEEYINTSPKETQAALREIRKAIKESAPKAEEMISYMMPAYKLNKKPLVYFGLSKNHIGFYPTPNGITKFKKELSKYQTGKGTAQFPLNEKIPLNLVRKITKFRAQEVLSQTKKK